MAAKSLNLQSLTTLALWWLFSKAYNHVSLLILQREREEKLNNSRKLLRAITLIIFVGLLLASMVYMLTIETAVAQTAFEVRIDASPGGGGLTTPSGTTLIETIPFGITATANSGYHFLSWTASPEGSLIFENPDSPSTSIEQILSVPETITANFQRNSYLLSVSTVGSGSVAKNPDKATYNHGDSVQLSASPVAGWSFSGWSGDATGSANPLTVTMNSAKVITATFTQNSYSLTVNTVGSGSVTKTPNLTSYLSGASVQLSASPVAGWRFSGWSGDVTGLTNPVNVTMNSDKTINATFTQITWAITVTQSSHGTISPASASYAQGSSQIETITPESGYYILSMTVDGSPVTVTSNNSQTFSFNNIQAAHSITATFAQITYQITVTQSSHGTISPSTASYAQGSSPEETIKPDNGYFIANITVDGNLFSVTSNSGQIVSFNNIQAAHSITATFVRVTYQITVTQSAHGTISPASASYAQGSSQIETITPESGYFIASITVDGNPLSVTLSSGQNVSFSNIQAVHSITAAYAQYSYALSVSTVGGGIVSKSPNKASYNYGDTVILTATPAAGWSFSAWSGPFANSINPVTLKVNNTLDIIATFTQDRFNVTFTANGSGTTSPTGTRTYPAGSIVDLVAFPANSYSFSSWSSSGSISLGDASSSSTTATINGAGTITANFVEGISTPSPTQNTTPQPTQTTPSGTTNPTSKPSVPVASSTPIVTPPPSNSIISQSVIATADDGSKIIIIVRGDINGSEISEASIAADQNGAKTTITLTLIGQSGLNSYCNLTIPKSAVPYGTIPNVYLNNQVASEQEYTQDAGNFYVGFKSDVSTYELSVVFNSKTEMPILAAVIVAIISIVLVVVILLPRMGFKLGFKLSKNQIDDISFS